MRHFLIFLMGFCFYFSGMAHATEPLTLEKAYELALAKSETIGQRREDLELVQGRFYKAFNVILPKVSYQMTFERQDATSLGGGTDGFSNSFTRESTPTAKWTFSQPIFSGFRQIAALQSSGADRRQYEMKLRRAKEMLFQEVMETYYALIQLKQDVRILESVQEILSKRMAELEARAKLGRSRDSEAHNALSDLKTNEADMEEVKRLLEITEELFGFYIGQSGPFELVDAALPSDPTRELEAYSALAKSRADVQAAQNAHWVATRKTLEAQSGFLPNVSLDGNYYTRRVGFQSDIDWDVLLTVDIPVFDRLNALGDVKLAQATEATARLEAQKIKRQALLDIMNRYQDWIFSQRMEMRLKEALDAEKKNYELVEEEYRLNWVNNLQVLDVLKDFQQVQRRHNQSYFDMKKSFWKLKVAIGVLPTDPKHENKAKP